jgi:hypothetical protein
MNSFEDTTDIATVIILNRAGQFYVHQRSQSKKIFPGCMVLELGVISEKVKVILTQLVESS